ncbi:sideroflexin-4 isoform X2 [Rhineura floridana]|uniref:sideroflexin-4 isoform X2 n=1 Tax=Rhineura floridana TaxID=261503 RepID=UPI002AC83F54|nr:sideroflexin-4 isoform X2 [Rhineura floridana]
MDLNLQFWRSEGKTFFQRFRHWTDILDPTFLFISSEEIEKARTLLQASEENITESLRDKKINEAWKLSLASVNSGTGETIPALLRPPAFFPFTVPLVIAVILPHRQTRHALMCQFLFHTYTSGFSLANGNSLKESNGTPTEKEIAHKQLLLAVGAVTYSSCMGVIPHYMLTRYKPKAPFVQLLCKNIIPGPLTALLCAFNVTVIRNSELENGIEVMDSKGQVIGMSQIAGRKAVEETALSRAAVFATAMFIPDIALHFIKRYFISKSTCRNSSEIYFDDFSPWNNDTCFVQLDATGWQDKKK